MKFIRKRDNPSGEMGITHKGKPEGRLHPTLLRYLAVGGKPGDFDEFK